MFVCDLLFCVALHVIVCLTETVFRHWFFLSFLNTGGGSGGGGAGGNGGNAGSDVSNALVGDREKDKKKLAPVSITLVSFAVSRKAYTKVRAGVLNNTAHGDGQNSPQLMSTSPAQAHF